jgi:hypothetical protein
MNKLKPIILSICLLFIISCKRSYEEPTIEKDKLIKILADMHIAEEMVTKFRLMDRDSVRNLYFKEIGIIHKIDTSEITNQINILQSNPEFSFDIYQEVYKFLDNKSNSANKQKKE